MKSSKKRFIERRDARKKEEMSETIEHNLAVLNLALGNCIRKFSNDRIIEQNPSDSGAGTISVSLIRFNYIDDESEEIAGYSLMSGYVHLDLTTGAAYEPQWEEPLEWFNTFTDAYRYVSALYINR